MRESFRNDESINPLPEQDGTIVVGGASACCCIAITIAHHHLVSGCTKALVDDTSFVEKCTPT